MWVSMWMAAAATTVMQTRKCVFLGTILIVGGVGYCVLEGEEHP